MKIVKNWHRQYINKIIEEPESANQRFVNGTKNDEVLFLSFLIKTVEIIHLIFYISYMFGMVWMCLVIQIKETKANGELDSFYDHYKMDEITPQRQALISTYFAFTSLGTFGLGDFFPQNNIERLFIAFMLLFGVAIFSYVMGNFIELLNYFLSYTAGFDDGDQLSKFFGAL